MIERARDELGAELDPVDLLYPKSNTTQNRADRNKSGIPDVDEQEN